ncbi:hypothetical protein KM043_006079 [Ampulex compressa]|nr:hypothetical protein KM043_006079 [Ampulex compressa]
MCDCPVEEDGRAVGERSKMETLFERCREAYPPGRARDADALDASREKPIESEGFGSVRASSPTGSRSASSRSGDDSAGRVLSKATRGARREVLKGALSAWRCKRVGAAERAPWQESGGELDGPRVSAIGSVAERSSEDKSIERTLAIVKPEAVAHVEEIERRIFEEGFEIYQRRRVRLTAEQASEFYSDRYGELGYVQLVAHMSSKPIVVLVLAKRNAVADWRAVMGPTKVRPILSHFGRTIRLRASEETFAQVAEARLYFPDSLRAKYGSGSEETKNALHGSISEQRAEREIRFFFAERNARRRVVSRLATPHFSHALPPFPFQ